MVAAPKFDQVKVGDTIKPIVLPPISRHQLALYCGGSGDHNPIHVDLDFAKKFGFKDVFAHGMLSMGFLGRLVTSYAPRDRIRKLGTRFTSITWPGDVITLSGKVTGKREEGGEKLIDLEVKCTNQNGQDTLQGHATVAPANTLPAGWPAQLMTRWRRQEERQMGQMDGKVAIVTGSGRGIGKEIALRLVRDGASVVINDIDEAPAKETIAEIVKMGGKAVACNGDVAKPDFGDRIVKTAVDAFGDCHVVVNNAGYTWDSVIQKMSDEQWYAILDVHLTAPFRVLRAFQQHFRQQVEKERSAGKRIVRKVVNISSTSGVNGNAGQSNYSAGKAGIVGLTKTLAKEFGRYDVTVNAVAFGYIQTRLTKPLNEGEAGEIEVQGRKVKIGVQGGRIAAMNQMIPLGRGGLPEEAAGSVYLFCSPDSDYVSGQCLVVNGGL